MSSGARYSLFPPRPSTLPHLPERLAYRVTSGTSLSSSFKWVQSMQSPGKRLEAGKKVQLGYLFHWLTPIRSLRSLKTESGALRQPSPPSPVSRFRKCSLPPASSGLEWMHGQAVTSPEQCPMASSFLYSAHNFVNKPANKPLLVLI